MQKYGPFGCSYSFVRFDRNDFSLLPLEGELLDNQTPPASMVLADQRLKDALDAFETKLLRLKSLDLEQILRHADSLSQWLKHQDELIVSDAERLKRIRSKVKLLVRDFEIHALPLGKHLKHREVVLEKRFLKVKGMVKECEAKYFQKPLGDTLAPMSKWISRKEFEAKYFQKPLGDTLAPMSEGVSPKESEAKYVQNPLVSPELDKKVAAVFKEMLGVNQAVNSFNLSVPSNVDKYLPTSVKIDERSLADLQQALQQQNEAIIKLRGLLLLALKAWFCTEHKEQGEQPV